MLLRDLVDTSGVAAATPSRKAKVAAIAERLAQAEVAELPVVTAYLGGTVLQRRTGVGWRGVSSLPEPAHEPTLTALDVHETLDHLAALAGPGSQEARASGVRALFARATADAPTCRPELLQARADRLKGGLGWRIELFLPAEALHGFDPETNRRLGFAYQVTDPDRDDQFLGVGRGADLLLYGLTVVFLGYVAASYRRMRQMEQQVTVLAR